MRLFVTLGTHPQQFNRLLKKIDSLIEKGEIKGEVFAQTGNSDYIPRNYSFKKFIALKEYEEEFKKSDIIISHGGAGAIINALKFKKPLIIVPRLKRFSEHTDDHQIDLVQALDKKKKAIGVFDLKELASAIKKAKRFSAIKKSERKKLIKRIKKFLEECE